MTTSFPPSPGVGIDLELLRLVSYHDWQSG